MRGGSEVRSRKTDDDVLVGEAVNISIGRVQERLLDLPNDKTILGRIVLVLRLGDETSAREVVSLSLTSTLLFDLEARVVRRALEVFLLHESQSQHPSIVCSFCLIEALCSDLRSQSSFHLHCDIFAATLKKDDQLLRPVKDY